ncbi:DNA repair protein endonuclease SAE2/CtIP C-terminus-domain-containing protein [Dactylonectria estremocensis]|uniref:DNA repair protein endonuclease SAE2/CtIP C-terminus-domain-containing protein n=1 Tax=Dactylonectria estremocensis TaxID=1079267 RepID=A0A9P9EZT9_9HYPO|nr:DNA repair protein endonuclease SAE2/CtIP C-terminus-domain-containing protein [Dactylonectria estremocensis]
MTSWFETGRPEILNAIAAACGRVDEVIQRDLELAKYELETAQNERDEQSLLVMGLRAENARLKSELQAAETAKVTRNPQDANVPLASTSSRTTDDHPSETQPDWKAECARVSSKFNALSENFTKAKDALQKRKDERDKWSKLCGLLEKKIKMAEEEHGIRIIDRGSRSGRVSTNSDMRNAANQPSPTTSFTSEAGLEQAELELPPLAAASLTSEGGDVAAPNVAGNPQSESTQEGSDPRESDDLPDLPAQNDDLNVLVKQEPSSDPPVVVSERPVRKRKRDGPEPIDSPVRKIKLELSDGSSPVAFKTQNTSDLHDCIDLGDVAQRMSTPRKRKELEDSARSVKARPETLANTSKSTPFFVRADSNPQTTRPPDFSSALTPLSVNRRVMPAKDKPSPVPRLRKDLSHHISAIAEDGAGYNRGKEPQPKSGTKPVPKGRLDTLLNSPSTRDDEAITRSNPRPRAKASLLPDDLLIPGRRELPFEQILRSRDKTTSRQADTPSHSALAKSRLPPQDTRSPLAHKGSTSLLRNKRPSELRPDDFKVNPLVNEGLDFAFTEVVRDRNERACLSGCTDMHCCGKEFRALALSQRPNPPLTAAQRQEEQKLLEEYLGDSAFRLATMDKAERDDLWVEAKTQELANKYGKHRHRYSRMRSPPGFWNADFPSTQQLEEERTEAAKRDEQSVQERYREAMRPGGRWIFRDE